MPEAAQSKRRGRPKVYSDRLMLKAWLIRIIRRLDSASSRLTFLEPETELTVQLRPLLTEAGYFPSRRTWERR
jgi:hypothetical protein